jgi:hypothetical protein
MHTFRHGSSAPSPRHGWQVAPFPVPWRSYLLPFIFLELLSKVILLLLGDVIIEFRSRSRIGVGEAVELWRLSSETCRYCEASKLQWPRDGSSVLGKSIYYSVVFRRMEGSAWKRS